MFSTVRINESIDKHFSHRPLLSRASSRTVPRTEIENGTRRNAFLGLLFLFYRNLQLRKEASSPFLSFSRTKARLLIIGPTDRSVDSRPPQAARAKTEKRGLLAAR